MNLFKRGSLLCRIKIIVTIRANNLIELTAIAILITRMIEYSCFCIVGLKHLVIVKSSAHCLLRKQPDIFCFTFIQRMACFA